MTAAEPEIVITRLDLAVLTEACREGEEACERAAKNVQLLSARVKEERAIIEEWRRTQIP